MRRTCARVLAGALMAIAVATAMSLPGWLAPGAEPHRALTTPPSSSQRVIHVVVGATGHKEAGKAVRGRLTLAGRSPALAGRIVATHPSSSGSRAIPHVSVSSAPVSARTRPPRKPRPSAPGPAPTPAPVSTPAPQPGSGVAAPPPTSLPTRGLASAAPEPAAAPPPPPPAENTSAKAQRREGQADQPDTSDPGSSGCGGDHGSSRGDRDDDDQGQDSDGNRRSGDHGGRGRDE
jgi:hypothetical protein